MLSFLSIYWLIDCTLCKDSYTEVGSLLPPFEFLWSNNLGLQACPQVAFAFWAISVSLAPHLIFTDALKNYIVCVLLHMYLQSTTFRNSYKHLYSLNFLAALVSVSLTPFPLLTRREIRTRNLNKNAPLRLIYFSAGHWGVPVTWEALGGATLLEDVSHCFWIQRKNSQLPLMSPVCCHVPQRDDNGLNL